MQEGRGAAGILLLAVESRGVVGRRVGANRGLEWDVISSLIAQNGTYSRLFLHEMGRNLVPFFAVWDEITSRFRWFSGRDYVPFGGKWDENASRFWNFDFRG